MRAMVAKTAEMSLPAVLPPLLSQQGIMVVHVDEIGIIVPLAELLIDELPDEEFVKDELF